MRSGRTPHPLLYEINTRVWLRELAARKKDFSLAKVPDSVLDELADLGFDFVWLMGVWQGGEASRQIARRHAGLQAEFSRVLPDWKPADVIGSPYAVQDYRVARTLGGPKALAKLRGRLARRGIRLILDCVPNHTARDHPWVRRHPEFYVHGNEETLRREPENYFAARTVRGRTILAHGRDPHFSGWTDTAQLNYRHPRLRAAMLRTLLDLAGQCDGLRCDMAMLELEDIFTGTWGEAATPTDAPPATGEFWTEGIETVQKRHPDFLFIAEAYWAREAQMQALGFDYTYDKVLYDRLVQQDAQSVRGHLQADLAFQERSIRFLENHDEPRAAEVFPPDRHRAAAVVCYTAPGMRLFHQGQLDGRHLRLPIQLRRLPRELQDRDLRMFYENLLAALRRLNLRRARWSLPQPRPAWEGNWSFTNIIASQWEADPSSLYLVAVNLSPHQAQCYLPLSSASLRDRRASLQDLLSPACYEREGNSLVSPGLYLDLSPYQAHLFSFSLA